MRILIVSAYFPPHLGGVEVVAGNHARSLAADGHDVTVATTHTEPATPRRETVDGFTVVRLPARNVLERRAGIPYPLIGPAFCRGLRRLVAECDAVHVHDVLYQPSQLAAILARLAGKPLFATQNIGPVHHPRRVVRGVERITRATAGRYVWRHARRITAHNPLVYQHLRAQGVPADRIVTTPNGIDTTVFRPGPVRDAGRWRARLGVPVGQPVVLFVGRLIGQKGLPALLAATGPEYRIVVVGAGTPPDRGVHGVAFAGPVARHDLVDLYRLADVFVLPSTGEVFPLAVQEAMACGVPVITTDDPRYDDLGVDRRLLRLVPAEPVALRAAVLAVLADPRLGAEMADYGRRYAAARFEWRHNQKPLLAMYDRT
ncbi:MAG: D-inositol-3-phosphate glycosyltransferase [Micromonosporaceae bacterium]|nr:D-inositol-3-phosphate glycosyltransferase [Micromonosporaceae bacterium]